MSMYFFNFSHFGRKMDLDDCINVTEETKLPSSSAMTPAVSLTTIIDDCKECIFEYLEWPHLLNLADTSKHLITAVCNVFKRKYRNAKIDIGRTNFDWYFDFLILPLSCIVDLQDGSI